MVGDWKVFVSRWFVLFLCGSVLVLVLVRMLCMRWMLRDLRANFWVYRLGVLLIRWEVSGRGSCSGVSFFRIVLLLLSCSFLVSFYIRFHCLWCVWCRFVFAICLSCSRSVVLWVFVSRFFQCSSLGRFLLDFGYVEYGRTKIAGWFPISCSGVL